MASIYKRLKLKKKRKIEIEIVLYCRGKLVHQSQRVGKEKSTQAKHTNISTCDKPSATSRTPYRLRDENVLIMEKTNLPGLSYPA